MYRLPNPQRFANPVECEYDIDCAPAGVCDISTFKCVPTSFAPAAPGPSYGRGPATQHQVRKARRALKYARAMNPYPSWHVPPPPPMSIIVDSIGPSCPAGQVVCGTHYPGDPLICCDPSAPPPGYSPIGPTTGRQVRKARRSALKYARATNPQAVDVQDITAVVPRFLAVDPRQGGGCPPGWTYDARTQTCVPASQYGAAAPTGTPPGRLKRKKSTSRYTKLAKIFGSTQARRSTSRRALIGGAGPQAAGVCPPGQVVCGTSLPGDPPICCPTGYVYPLIIQADAGGDAPAYP